MPMVPSSIPKDNDIKAVLTDLLSMTMTLTMPMNTTAKYSAEENDRAILAKGGDRRVIRTPLTTPPMAEHMMAMPSAFETKPFLLSLYPPSGRHVHGVPGNVEQDSRDRSSEDPAAVDPAHEQQRGDDPHDVGERQDQNDRIHHRDPRQRAGQDADDQAGRHHAEVEWFENIAKTREKQLPSAHNVTP
jgi:hypothetical protein